MLILTRTPSQSVLVEINGVRLEISVMEVRGDKVRIGFNGPRDFKIIRAELPRLVAAENKAAGSSGLDQRDLAAAPVSPANAGNP